MQRPIVLLSPLLPPLKGGLADHSWHLAKHLSKDHPVAVLSSRDVYTDAPFSIRATVHDWEDMGELILELGALPSDALLLWQYVPHMYGRGGVNRQLAELWRRMRQEGRKQVILAHEIAAPWGRWPNQWWYAWNHRKQWRAAVEVADLLPISTEAWTLDWQRRMQGAARKMLTLPSPTSIESVAMPEDHRTAWRAEQGLPADIPILLWWGTVSGAKQLMWVVDAWETACARLGPVVLCIVGGNPAVSLPGSLRPWTRILGYLKAGEVSRCLAAADLVALPFVDGVSERRTTLMAGLDHGVAVAGTWGHNTGPALKKGGFVSLTPAQAGEAFVENVVRLLRDHDERKRLGAAGKAWHDANASWPVVTRRLVDAMREENLLSVVPLPKR